MEITLNKDTEVHGLINVKFGENDYKQRVDEKLKDYSKKANIKGFRPGKVPAGLINKMYGKSIKVEEINRLVAESVDGYIKEQDLKLIGDPLPQTQEMEGIDWGAQKDFEFNYEVGLVPEFDIPLSDKSKFTKHEIKVDEKTLDKTILNIRKQSGERKEIDIVNENCIVSGELSNETEEFTKASEMDISLMSGSKEKKSLIGKAKEDEVEINIIKAYDKEPDELSRITGKALVETKKMKGKFKFRIDKIEELELAEMNQELYDKSIGPDKAKDEATFRTEVEKIIAKNNDGESEGFLKRQIQDYLVEKTKLDLPSDFLKKWLKATNEGKLTDEQIENEFDMYQKELKWNLIISKIQKDQKLEVQHEDVVNETRQMVMNQFGGGFNEEQMGDFLEQFVQNYLKENNGQNYMNVHRRLLDNQVMDWARGKVSVKDKKVSWEEFEKIVLK